MSYAYPIWNQVTACTYSGSKSWGAKQQASVSVKIGSSVDNSHGFVNHSVTKSSYRHEKHGLVIRFQFWVCDALVKETLFTISRHGTADQLISEKCAWIGAVCHKRIKQTG